MAKNDDVRFSDFTTGEKLRVIGLVARMAKRGMADDGSGRVLKDLQDRVARIEAKAQRRKNSK
ncbi:DUF6257 family protein [Streptomyces sp. CC219B]|uniref:DUF6257 family protein n=1 Tax=Streptomyces sp. CC219B TaxID=3044574 RepID=UPI0024A9130F|nr:DUF6257 family protein [Streptomyces sp. CC219B]